MSSIDRRRFPPSPGPWFRTRFQEQSDDAWRRVLAFLADRSAA
jgi:hypothetical protein